MPPAVFVFHRDLRVCDNTALDALLEATPRTDPVYLVFVLDPAQADRAANPFFSNAAFQFLCESLVEIPRLNVLVGDTVQALQELHDRISFDKLYQNSDISLFARQRDAGMRDWCSSRGILMREYQDYYLYDDDDMLVDRGKPYTVFAAFFKRCIKEGRGKIRRPSPAPSRRKFAMLPGQPRRLAAFLRKLYDFNPGLAQRGGRSRGLALLDTIPAVARRYEATRDFPADTRGTTRASAHLKFGTISPREFFWAVGKVDHPLTRELLFREFYAKVYSRDPKLQRGTAFDSKVDERVEWVPCEGELFQAWTMGRTGFPLVDAGMRQLRQTGWMHNRVRMVVACFATKYCLFDWRGCAKYFYTQLVDCDIFSNNAGWGFVSSTGVDPQPWYRFPMNPFLQSKKFDKDADYIKRWIPELRDVPAKVVHEWHRDDMRNQVDVEYPPPMLNHLVASSRAKRVFGGKHSSVS